jgi:hypothetical protein
MKKSRFLIIFYIISVLILNFPLQIKKSRADVITIIKNGVGNFLPEENCSLIMTNASVMFDVDAKYYHRKIYIDFKGNYTIYNPGESKNATLAAPFSSLFENLEESCIIKINNTPISFEFLEYNYSDPWDEYLYWYYMGQRRFITSNITFPASNSIKIQYLFNAYIEIHESVDALEIFYDVGTSRAWNGTISELVEFKVYGKRPDSYSENNCTISDIEDGISYLWEWNNETINVDRVYIYFSYFNPWQRLWPFIVFPSLIIGVVTLLLLARRRDKRRERERIIFINN